MVTAHQGRWVTKPENGQPTFGTGYEGKLRPCSSGQKGQGREGPKRTHQVREEGALTWSPDPEMTEKGGPNTQQTPERRGLSTSKAAREVGCWAQTRVWIQTWGSPRGRTWCLHHLHKDLKTKASSQLNDNEHTASLEAVLGRDIATPSPAMLVLTSISQTWCH